MKRYGLVGYPLGHSFSVRFFTDKFRREGLSAEYVNFEMPSVGGLRRLVSEDEALCGLNVTIPHKQAVIPLLDELSDEAREIGAVNVVCIRREGGVLRLRGCNSDAAGFMGSIGPLLRPSHRKALVLGTGGASKAVAYGLRRLGVEPVLVSRTARPGVLSYAQLTPAVMRDHAVVVNCSPVGMHPHVNECPAIPYDCLTPGHLLYDLVYNPEETLFLRRGSERGAAVKNGLEMLRLQALAAWDDWQAEW